MFLYFYTLKPVIADRNDHSDILKKKKKYEIVFKSVD